MEKIIIFPSKYAEAEGLITCLPRHITYNSIFIIADAFSFGKYKNDVIESLESAGKKCVMELFEGECTLSNITNIKNKAANFECVLGIGGGKALDAAKATAYFLSLPCIVLPTSVATNAPSSRIAVLYNDDGVLLKYLELKNSPEAILIDSEIIAAAPKKLMAAGIADALSSAYEALHTINENGSGGMVKSLAKECIHTLYGFSEQALIDADLKKPSFSIKNIIEAIILMSGICFESGGLYLAHAINNALTNFKPKKMHGECVAYGLIVQLRYENSPDLAALESFFQRLNLPTSLSDLELNLSNEEKKSLVKSVSLKEKINKEKLLGSL